METVLRGSFANNQRLGIALSGGPDSLALLLLAKAAYPNQIEAATVDHKLRVESAEEARYCATICAELGIPHSILAVQEPITGNLQSAARTARYALLHQWAADRNVDFILTAHHADDQAETFLMRLKRGSGVPGLAGVRARNKAVIRPLLGWRKAELEDIVREQGIKAVQDPSNRNEAFDRARLRKALHSLTAAQFEWVDPVAISKTAEHLADANIALDWAAEQYLGHLVTVQEASVMIAPKFGVIPHEIQRRILVSALASLDASLSIRGDTLDATLSNMANGNKAMLGDWIIAPLKAAKSGWIIERAPPRRTA